MKDQSKEKSIKYYKTRLIGFPIVILNVKMRKIMGEWCPLINWSAIERIALVALIKKPSSLTGEEVRFVRLYFGLTLEQLGKKLGVTPQAVKKWESKEDKPTNMLISTERNIRLLLLELLYSKEIKTIKQFKDMVDYVLNHTFTESSLRYFTFDAKNLKAA